MKRKDFVHKMRDILRKRRDALRRTLRGELSELTNHHSGVGDALDYATDSDCDEISSQLAAVESRELASIENALEKIRAGSYGECERCENDIPSARLQALPYATHCVNCQRHAERENIGESRRFNWSGIETRDEVDRGDELRLQNVEAELG